MEPLCFSSNQLIGNICVELPSEERIILAKTHLNTNWWAIMAICYYKRRQGRFNRNGPIPLIKYICTMGLSTRRRRKSLMTDNYLHWNTSGIELEYIDIYRWIAHSIAPQFDALHLPYTRTRRTGVESISGVPCRKGLMFIIREQELFRERMTMGMELVWNARGVELAER